jgi:hypothetical protein
VFWNSESGGGSAASVFEVTSFEDEFDEFMAVESTPGLPS